MCPLWKGKTSNIVLLSLVIWNYQLIKWTNSVEHTYYSRSYPMEKLFFIVRSEFFEHVWFKIIISHVKLFSSLDRRFFKHTLTGGIDLYGNNAYFPRFVLLKKPRYCEYVASKNSCWNQISRISNPTMNFIVCWICKVCSDGCEIHCFNNSMG